MNSLSFTSIADLQKKIKTKELSHEEILDFFLRRIEIFEPKIDSMLETFDKNSIIKASSKEGSLAGIPGIIKNNICIEGRKTTCASRILENFKAPNDATVIKRLKSEGALIVGTANMDEFAMGSTTESSAFKKTKNPWDLTRVPGGSSGGSAAAVAAGLAPWALGSDTGGSVRQPAAFCGVVGMKPTYGLVSRYGLIAYASSLDQIGVITRSVYDNALILSTIAGNDTKDSSSLAESKKDYTHHLDGRLPAGLKIGILDLSAYGRGINSEIATAIENGIKTLESLGSVVKTISLPTFDYSAAAYFIISRAEAASNLARFDGVKYGMRDKKASTLTNMYQSTRHNGFGYEVQSRIIVGNYVLSSSHAGEFYDNAKKAQRLMRSEILNTFKNVDIIIMPTHSTPAFTFNSYSENQLEIDLQDFFTCPVNMTGVPAISIPAGFTHDNLPIGMQLIGPHLSEELLYKVAHAFEQVTSWHTQHPPAF